MDTEDGGRGVRSSKVVSLRDAVGLIPDGARLAMGGLAVYQRPMAVARELVRQQRTGLTLVDVLSGPETDLLVAGRCVTTIETSYVGLERFGLARNVSRAVQNGEVLIEDYAEEVSFDRFRASGDGLSFVASSALVGSDLMKTNPRLQPFSCPLTGRPLVAVPPAEPDIVVIHAAAADQFGNVQAPLVQLLPQSFDSTKARSADMVIVTTEKLISTEQVQAHPERTVVPSFLVTAVAEVPFGAHPSHCLGAYELDYSYFQRYVADSRRDDTMTEHLTTYVRAVGDEAGYRATFGTEHLLALQTSPAL